MGDSVRESLASVMDAAEGGGGDGASTSGAAPADAPGPVAEAAGVVAGVSPDGAAPEGPSGGSPPDGPGGAAARDEKGRFAEKAKEAAKPVAKPAVAAAGATAPAPKAPAELVAALPPAAPEVPKAIAPASWKPGAREKWAALPPEVQQEVARREAEGNRERQEMAASRKFHQDFQAVVGPFEGMIRAEGGEPLKSVANLLQTAAALRTAPPQHKAMLVANLVKTFGVPIEALDQALAGQTPQGGQAGALGSAFQDPRVDQLLATIQQAQAQRGQAQGQKMQQELSSFASSHEFLEDVRQDMADLLDGASRRGVALSLEDAYNRAVRMHPDVSAVVEQRKAAEAAKASVASTQRARAAASSVKSQPAGGVSPSQPGSVRDTLLSVMSEREGR